MIPYCLETRSCANRVQLCFLAEIACTLFLPSDILLRPLFLAGTKIKPSREETSQARALAQHV